MSNKLRTQHKQAHAHTYTEKRTTGAEAAAGGAAEGAGVSGTVAGASTSGALAIKSENRMRGLQ